METPILGTKGHPGDPPVNRPLEAAKHTTELVQMGAEFPNPRRHQLVGHCARSCAKTMRPKAGSFVETKDLLAPNGHDDAGTVGLHVAQRRVHE